VLPCIACCKCFIPKTDEIDDLDKNKNTIWHRGITQKEFTLHENQDNEEVLSCEKASLLNEDSSKISYDRGTVNKNQNTKWYRGMTQDDKFISNENSFINASNSCSYDRRTISESVTPPEFRNFSIDSDVEDGDNDEEDMQFVVGALNDSRQSLRVLVSSG
jgi:hypothetical protein